ncbi:DUF1800 domain-containing protein [Deinococcus irradiatisoli]|uniref:DUF1800 domain-containing protein n=1 Tax=Deinococcus irradiatisoli TaxID=2202254 RepID=A0A2Z3JLJ2_9DEIO|nr:DUF1800 domain-containing protein [Deinococcus irradiatisoli]AWN24110.1 DUF1800 domain-containing protein [Deinococcus irradiatisoli]
MPLTPRTTPLSLTDAAHLLRRTGFGATEAQIHALVGRTPQAAADELLTFSAETLPTPFQPLGAVSPGAAIKLMQAAWLREMVLTPHPLRERLTLLWSNHFVIGTDKVKNVSALEGYLSALRTHALGRFGDLALAAVQTPAVLRYLDNDQNKKGKPNENLGRELLELFTAGIGHYSENDVKEGARALTGWTYQGGRGNKQFAQPQTFTFNARQHDAGVKTYLGQSGQFGGEDIVRLAAAHPATADRVAFKLWQAFVSDAPDPAGQAALADVLRQNGGDLRQTLAALLGSQDFYAATGRIIRSPVDFVVGALRASGRQDFSEKTYLSLTTSLARLGQELLHPPTVKGWDGGREWINDGTLLLRMQVAAALSLGQPKNPALSSVPPSALALLGRPDLPPAFAKLGPAQRTYLMLVSPEYQLL